MAASLAEQSRFYDDRWRGKSNSVLHGIRLKRAAVILEEISRLNLLNPNILDLGCGAGVFSGLLSVVGPVTGVDLSITAANEGAARFPAVQYLAGDAFSVQLSENAFDLLVLQEVIEHVNDQIELINRCYELLKPGGYLLVTTPNSKIAHYSGKMAAAKKRGRLQPIENLLTVREARDLIAMRFSIVRCFTIVPSGHYGWLRIVNSPRLNRYRFWRTIRGTLPIGLHTVVVAKKKTEP